MLGCLLSITLPSSWELSDKRVGGWAMLHFLLAGGGPATLQKGASLFAAGMPGNVAFRLHSGWIALTRHSPPFPAHGETSAWVVALVLPGEVVCADDLAAVGADAAVCLGEVTASTAEATLPRGPVATAAAFSHTAKARHRVAALLAELFDRLHRLGLAPGGYFLLPLTLEQFAHACGVELACIRSALEELLDSRVLRCAFQACEGLAIGVADATGLRALGWSHRLRRE